LADITFTSAKGAVYSILEPALGVVNACLPIKKPALKRLCGRVPRDLTAKDCSIVSVEWTTIQDLGVPIVRRTRPWDLTYSDVQ
jgi:hypothetical protein